MTRIGVELSATACRVIEVDAAPRWRDPVDTRVVSFASFGTDEAAARLQLFRGRRAAAVVWGVAADHRFAVVEPGPHRRMRTDVRLSLAESGMPLADTLSDLARIGRPTPRGQAVLLASASASRAQRILAPLAAAGVTVQALLTPAAALQSIARVRRREAAPGALEGFVALSEAATCLAIVRDGDLLASAELPWGYLDDGGFRAGRSRDEVAARLATALSRFVAACRIDSDELSRVSVCGGMPELRSMTIPLMERLDIEVETLDSLFGIDARRLPQPARDFAERAAEMRLAWAAAAVPRPAIDLYRDGRRRAARALLSRTALAAGAVALGAGWWTQTRGGRPQARSGETTAAASSRTDPPRAVLRAPVQRPPTSALPSAPFTPPTAVPPRDHRPPAGPIESAPPFDASLSTILFSAERKLAIVDGEIVQVGDEIRGARVVAITPADVFLRDEGGRIRRLSVVSPRF
jgi:hypothetical protein